MEGDKDIAADRPTAGAILVSFAKIGAMLIGGGYAMLPLLEEEVVRRRKWATSEEMVDFFALAQVLPGVIAINTAMLVGNRLRGLAGNVAAAVGLSRSSWHTLSSTRVRRTCRWLWECWRVCGLRWRG